MKWYVYHELPGMWYEIKQKQKNISKARANINVYSSTLFSGLTFEDEMICILRTARYVSFEVDSAAPWQRAPPLGHVQVAACLLYTSDAADE